MVGREDGPMFSCCFVFSTVPLLVLLIQVFQEKQTGSGALKQNEQLFHTWSVSLSSAEEQVQVNTLICSRGRPFILIPQFAWVPVHWLCHSLPGSCSTSCSSTCRLCAGQNKYITFSNQNSITSVHPAVLIATEM